MEVAKFPLAELSLPVLGGVGIFEPIKLVLEGKLTQTAGGAGAKAQGPYIAIGAKQDISLPGNIGFGIDNNGYYGFNGDDLNIDMKTNLFPELVRGTPADVAVNRELFLGVRDGIEISGAVKFWKFNVTSFDAEVIDISLGPKFSSSDLVQADGLNVNSSNRKLSLSVIPEVHPTISVSLAWMSKSLQIFDVDIQPLDIYTYNFPDKVKQLPPAVQVQDFYYPAIFKPVGKMTDSGAAAVLSDWSNPEDVTSIWLQSPDGIRISTIETPLPNRAPITFQKITKSTGVYRVVGMDGSNVRGQSNDFNFGY
jgi:hypothetical protein